ncbi:MAG: HAMP domain-containing histidine kinase [Calothrix sp. SM1_5_4]|nr:HAMP domain-containing histidine kinase [Calothrix sp. SM1_5_4]
MKAFKLYWGVSGPVSLCILAGLTSLWAIFLVVNGLRNECQQSSSIIRKGSGVVAGLALSGNLPELRNSISSFRTSTVSSLVFTGSDTLDAEVFGRVTIGNPPARWAHSCSTELTEKGLKIGVIHSYIDVPSFIVARLVSEMASVLFFWLLAIFVIIVANYRSLRMLGYISQSLETFARQAPENFRKDLRDDLARALESVPRNTGTRVILDSLSAILDNLAEVAEIRLRLVRAEDKASMARQVGHDIRSPLSALQILMKKSRNLSPEEYDLLNSCYERVEGVAKNLLSSSGALHLESSVEIVSCIAEVFREKKLQYPQVEWVFTFSTEQQWANFMKPDLQRILSNLMNNAVEAHASRVMVNVAMDKQSHLIKISDNGTGMSTDLLSKLQSGKSVSTKLAGHGLGLSYARKKIREVGGELIIRQSVWNGIEIEIRLASLGSALRPPQASSGIDDIGSTLSDSALVRRPHLQL